RKSTSYGNADSGGTVSATVNLTSSRAMVIVTGFVDPGANLTAAMSFAATGTNTIAASDANAVIREHGSSSGTGGIQASTTTVLTGLKEGSTTFTLQYKSGSSSTSANFENRSITVIPLG